MAAWNSSSLVASDSHSLDRHKSGLLNNTKMRVSKQHLVEHKMFGSKRGMHGTSLKIGKKFRKSGKGIMKGATSGGSVSENLKGGINPSIEQFDEMMKSVSSNNGNGKKKFSRKFFG
jgi:hypothetical protein